MTPGCSCATNVRRWFPCDIKHSWNEPATDDPDENFVLSDCPGDGLAMEARVVRNERLLESGSPPNVPESTNHDGGGGSSFEALAQEHRAWAYLRAYLRLYLRAYLEGVP